MFRRREGGREGGHGCTLPVFRRRRWRAFLLPFLPPPPLGVLVGDAQAHDGLNAVAAVLREGREGRTDEMKGKAGREG